MKYLILLRQMSITSPRCNTIDVLIVVASRHLGSIRIDDTCGPKDNDLATLMRSIIFQL